MKHIENKEKWKEDKHMPTAVLEAIENQINRKTPFEEEQEKRLKELREIINSKDEQRIENERKYILEKLKRAGILDDSYKLAKEYKD